MINLLLFLLIEKIYHNYFTIESQNITNGEIAEDNMPKRDNDGVVKVEFTAKTENVSQVDIKKNNNNESNIITQIIALAMYEFTIIVASKISHIVLTVVEYFIDNPTVNSNPVLDNNNPVINTNNVEMDRLANINTIYEPAVEGIQTFSNNEITTLMDKLYLYLSHEANVDLSLQNIIWNTPIASNFFTHNPDDLRNANHIVNLIIQEAIIRYSIIKDPLYFKIGLAIFTEQMNYIGHNQSSVTLEIHFRQRFPIVLY